MGRSVHLHRLPRAGVLLVAVLCPARVVRGGQEAAPAQSNAPSQLSFTRDDQGRATVHAIRLAYPLRVERYALRTGSGGDGRFRGGDGVVRELRVLERCRLSLLTQRRALGPRGADGGGDGLPGRNLLNGVELPAFATVDLEPGDVLRIETPGGGGYGAPGSR